MIWTKINILRMWTYESTLISSRRICSPAAPRFWQWYFSSLCAWNQRNNPANPYDRLSRTIRWYRLLNGYDKLRNAPKRLFRPKTQISGNEIFRQALQESPVHHLRDAASFRRAEIFVPGKCGLIKNVHHLMYWSVYKKRKNVLHINSSSS